MRFLKASTHLLSLLALCHLFAIDCQNTLFPATRCIEDRCEPSETMFTADVSLLAWQSLVGGLEFVLKNDPLPIQSNTNVNGRLIAPHFSWEPAMKLQVGTAFASRAWDMQFRWTYFQTDASRTVETAVNAATSGLFPLWVLPSANIATQFLYGSATGSYTLRFDGFDLEMGYHPYLTPNFLCRFITGLKVTLIDQKFHLHYGDGFNDGVNELVSAKTDLTNDSIGTGPRLGFLSEWQLGRGFSFVGLITGSLPLWHIRVIRTDNALNIQAGTPQSINSVFRSRFWIFRSILETALGFSWKTCFGCRDQYPFGVDMSYELQYYSEQNMMSMLVNPGVVNQSFMPRQDLLLHGANFTFHFGF